MTNSTIPAQFLKPNGTFDKSKFLRAYYKHRYRYKQLEEVCLDLEADKDLYKMAKMLGFRDLYEPLHREFCDFIMDPTHKKKIGLMPRGHFKTSISNISYVPWRIVKDPNIKILLYSGLRDKAKGMLAPIRNILANHPRFVRRFGSFEGSRVWNKSEILVRQAERNQIDNTYTVETSGVDEAVTSKHFDLIIFDDVVTRKNAKELSQRLKVKEAFDEAVDSLLKPDGEVIVLGTIWHFDDLYIDILDNDNYDSGGEYLVYKRSAWEGYKDLDHLWDEGHAIMPTFYTKEILKKKEKKNEYLFWCNWLNIPRVSKNKPLNYQWLEFYDPAKVMIREVRDVEIIMDPASGKDNQWNDSAAYVVVGRWRNKIIILDMFKDQVDTQALCEVVFKAAIGFPMARFIHIEDAAEQIHLINYAKRELSRWKSEGKITHDVQILEDIKPRNRNKEQRIAQLRPFYQDKTFTYPSVIMHETHSHGRRMDMMKLLKLEMDQFPLGDHDDLLDVNSYILDVYGMEIEDYVDYSIDKRNKSQYNLKQDNETLKTIFQETEQEDSDDNTFYDKDLEEVIEI